MTPRRPALRLESLEARDVPAVMTQDAVSVPLSSSTAATQSVAAQPADDAIGTIELAPRTVVDRLAPRGRYAVASGAGSTAHVDVYDAVTNAKVGTITPYDAAFTGGARVATGDVTGDGVDDVVVAPGPGGGSWVKVYDGVTLDEVRAFQAYTSSFAGGVFVAVGDVDGDGRADVITGAGPGGGPHVQVFSGRTHAVLDSFFAYDPSFTGGVYVAAGDTTGGGHAQIATAPMAGGAPQVRVFDNSVPVANLAPFDLSQRSGATVAVQDVNNDGRADVIVGSGPTAAPAVKVLDARSGADLRDVAAADYLGGLYVG